MERFGSIKSNKSVNQIQNLCRLCGMNNPGMTLICEDLETDVIDLDDDPSLQRKIEACIGILVSFYLFFCVFSTKSIDFDSKSGDTQRPLAPTMLWHLYRQNL